MPAEDYWETFFDTRCVLDALDYGQDSGNVIEFGCGYGTFTEEAARRTGETVFAIDIDPTMVEATQLRAERAELKNVEAICRDFVAAGTGLPDASDGFTMVFNVLHIEHPVELLREALRNLRPGGTAGIIHWKYDSSTPRGPSMSIRPRPEQCREWATAAGFDLVRNVELKGCEHHYGIAASRPF